MRKVLIAEEDTIQSEALRLLLERAGYSTVSVCPSGAEALTEILEKKPDLVVADIELKGILDGIDLAVMARNVTAVPFIFISAGKLAADVPSRLPKNSVFLSKPVTYEELLQAIGRLTRY